MYRNSVPRFELDRTRIERFLARAAQELEGEWLLIGGAAAAVWFAPERTTDAGLTERRRQLTRVLDERASLPG